MAASVQYHILRTGAPQNRVRVASRDELQLVYDGPHAEFQAPDREPMHAIRVTLTKHTEVVDHLPRLEIPRVAMGSLTRAARRPNPNSSLGFV